MDKEIFRAKINKEIESATDADKKARLKLAREYFTNLEFAKKFSDFAWKYSQARKCGT